jgi:hypothetical protein
LQIDLPLDRARPAVSGIAVGALFSRRCISGRKSAVSNACEDFATSLCERPVLGSAHPPTAFPFELGIGKCRPSLRGDRLRRYERVSVCGTARALLGRDTPGPPRPSCTTADMPRCLAPTTDDPRRLRPLGMKVHHSRLNAGQAGFFARYEHPKRVPEQAKEAARIASGAASALTRSLLVRHD